MPCRCSKSICKPERSRRRIKTGYLVGARRKNINTVGGASPSTVAVGSRAAYVSNATNDTISVIDTAKNEIVSQIELNVPGLEALRGVLPFGLDLSPDEAKLYVACAGLNAVAVVDTAAGTLEGYIPAGWFCSFVQVAKGGASCSSPAPKASARGPTAGADSCRPSAARIPATSCKACSQRVDVPDTPTTGRIHAASRGEHLPPAKSG